MNRTDPAHMVFDHVTLGQRVLFGAGRAAENVMTELDRHGAQRVMVITSTRDTATGARLVPEDRAALRWTEVTQHVPAELADRARTAAAGVHTDLLLAVGGGSAIGLGKAIALTTHLPLVVVPTTYAGSEATDIWGVTENQTKTTGSAPQVLPCTVVYDADLSLHLPLELSVSSGLNALAHCVDSLWAPRADPVNRALALEGARALALALPGIVRDSTDRSARDQALYGCYLAAVAFASAGSGLHHKICHVLGGTFDLPHAQTHAVVLPYVVALNVPGAPEPMARLAQALDGSAAGHDDAPAAALTALTRLRESVGAPNALGPLGLERGDLPEAVRRVLSAAPSSNPVEVTEAAVTGLLSDALVGALPQEPYRPSRDTDR